MRAIKRRRKRRGGRRHKRKGKGRGMETDRANVRGEEVKRQREYGGKSETADKQLLQYLRMFHPVAFHLGRSKATLA